MLQSDALVGDAREIGRAVVDRLLEDLAGFAVDYPAVQQADLGQYRAALRTARQAVASLQRFVGSSGGGLRSDAGIHWQQARAALALGQQGEARQALDNAYAELISMVFVNVVRFDTKNGIHE